MQGAQSESRFRGIGRYSMSIAQAISEQAGNHEVWLALNAQFPESILSIRSAFERLIPESRIRIFDVPTSSKYEQWPSLASEIIREEFIASLKPDVLLLTSIFEGYNSPAVTSIGVLQAKYATAVILYDLIPLLNQEQYLQNNEIRNYYFRKVEWVKRADMLLAISESSRKEGIDHLGCVTEQVVNISTAVSSQFQYQELTSEAWKTICHRVGIDRKFVMYAPGGFDPRKNFGRLIEAFSKLPNSVRAEYQLLIVSKLNLVRQQELESLREQYQLGANELLLPGYVEDEILTALYSKAELFVFPSLHEGFGLPALEAMACGAIVIGSNCTSIPEVIGRDDALFDPSSADDIGNKMLQALTDMKFRNDLRLHGQKQVKKFTWRVSGSKAIQALEQLHERTKKRKQLEVKRESVNSALANLSRMTTPRDHDLRLAAHCLAFNMGSKRPQLLLDISSLVRSDAKSGIQRVVRSLLAEFLNNPPSRFDVKPIWFDEGIYRYAESFIASLTGYSHREGDSAVGYAQGDVYLSLDLIMHLTPQVHELHRNLAARGLQLNFIVYDILLAQHPEWWPAGTDAQFKCWLKSICEVSTRLICISQAVATDMRDWIRNNQPQRVDAGPTISSFHLGADLENSFPTKGLPESSLHVLQQIDARKSFLMVSTIEPRKGYAQALAAFELLWQKGSDINLVIVGKRGWLVDDLARRISEHSENGRRLFWLEGISDEYLALVYQKSACLIAASEGEGFGLPLIEAAQHSLPLIVRDLPVFREVAGSHAHYFSGKESSDLSAAIEEWLSMHADSQHPRSDDMPWLNWTQSAQQLMRALQIEN
jgi:glycosyltransferase involved in cell wall biosynthesis